MVDGEGFADEGVEERRIDICCGGLRLLAHERGPCRPEVAENLGHWGHRFRNIRSCRSATGTRAPAVSVSSFLHLLENGLRSLSLFLGGCPPGVDVELPMSAEFQARMFIAESEERRVL